MSLGRSFLEEEGPALSGDQGAGLQSSVRALEDWGYSVLTGPIHLEIKVTHLSIQLEIKVTHLSIHLETKVTHLSIHLETKVGPAYSSIYSAV